MSGGTLVLGGHLSGETDVQGDSCPRGHLSWGGHLSRGTNVGATLVGGTNVTTPMKLHRLSQSLLVFPLAYLKFSLIRLYLSSC